VYRRPQIQRAAEQRLEYSIDFEFKFSLVNLAVFTTWVAEESSKGGLLSCLEPTIGHGGGCRK